MNNKKILIINSRHPSLIALFNIFEELSNYNYHFNLFANDKKMLNKFKEKKWFYKKIPKFFIMFDKYTLCSSIVLSSLGLLYRYFFLP